MIGKLIDRTIGVFSPTWATRRVQGRAALERAYEGARTTRLSPHRPVNQTADVEMRGPYGADSMRAWSRMLVRDNAYASGVVDTIVSSVVGCGIQTESALEDDDATNDKRDAVWRKWCKVADINGELTFDELQALAQREIVEAGECLLHFVNVPTTYKGITRPVPLALELIEADRFATTKDTLRPRADGTRIERGVEMDAEGRVIQYWVHPSEDMYTGQTRSIPLPANKCRHLFRKDRIGQSRGVSWFSPVATWLRDMGTYLENELQASAVASCFTAAIKSDSAVNPLKDDTSADTSDTDGNPYDFIQPGTIMHLSPGESIDFGSPGRTNGEATPWLQLLQRGIAVGTGLSYETVARDYSQTTFSSNRASQLEDRRRFRRWQKYLVDHMCDPTYDQFCEAAAMVGLEEFPTLLELLDDREAARPVQHQATGWEWVDPKSEQAASEAAISANQSTLQDELGLKGRNWKRVIRQRKREEEFIDEVGLGEREPETLNGAQIESAVGVLEKLMLGTIAAGAAVQLLVALGISVVTAEAMVDAQEKDAEPPPDPIELAAAQQSPGQPDEDEPASESETDGTEKEEEVVAADS